MVMFCSLKSEESAVNRQAVALGFASTFLATAVPSVAATPPVLKGETYDHARTRIIKLGYRPVRFVRTEDGCMLDTTCKRYPELIGCGSGRQVVCKFAFADLTHRKYLLVTAQGQPRRVASIQIPSSQERKSWPLIQR